MFYKILADTIVVLHLLWIAFLIFGAFPGRRYRWVKIVHISGMGFAVLIQIIGWYCPLTHLEVWLRRLEGTSEEYSGSFIINYAMKIIYIELSANMIFTGTIFLIMMSAGIYLYRPGGKK